MADVDLSVLSIMLSVPRQTLPLDNALSLRAKIFGDALLEKILYGVGFLTLTEITNLYTGYNVK